MQGRSMRKAVVAVAMVVTLCGCGGSGSALPAATVTVTPTATASPTIATPAPTATTSVTPVYLTMAEARKRYLKIVAPSNKAGGVYGRVSSQNLKVQKKAAAKYAKSVHAFAQAVRATRWPKKVQKNADALADALSAQQASFSALQHARTYSEFIAINNEDAYKAGAKSSQKAGIFRDVLGLPPIS